MLISLKSNRNFILKIFVPPFIAMFFFLVLMIILLAIHYEELKGETLALWLPLAEEAIFLFVILMAKFYRGKSYTFTEEKITAYKRGKILFQLELKNVQKMYYYSFKLRYIITIFAGALNEGGCWKLHVVLVDGTKKELGFLSKKDIQLLNKSLYSDLIIY